MRDILVVLVHSIVTVVRLIRPSGLRAVVAESAVLRNKSARRRTNELPTKQDEPLRSSPEMKICEIMGQAGERRPVKHNGAVEAGNKTGQADI